MLAHCFGRHQHLDVVADDLVGPITEQLLAGGVVHLDAAAPVDDDQSVDQSVEHGVDECLKARLAGAQAGIRRHAIADVPGDLAEAKQRSIAGENRRDDHVCREPASILADPPSAILETTVGDCFLQGLIGFAGGDVCGRVEDGKMPADNLAGVISLDGLRAGIPRRHSSVGRERDDRVVTNAFDEQPKMLNVVRSRRSLLAHDHAELPVRLTAGTVSPRRVHVKEYTAGCSARY